MRIRSVVSAAAVVSLVALGYATWLRVEAARLGRAEWAEVADPVD